MIGLVGCSLLSASINMERYSEVSYKEIPLTNLAELN